MVANTENKGAFIFVLPAGESGAAIPEGFILDVIGPDQRDTKGNNWKHVRYGTISKAGSRRNIRFLWSSGRYGYFEAYTAIFANRRLRATQLLRRP